MKDLLSKDQRSLVRRLRYGNWRGEAADLLMEAADEIERLQALLKEALEAWEGSGPPIVLDRLREALGR